MRDLNPHYSLDSGIYLRIYRISDAQWPRQGHLVQFGHLGRNQLLLCYLLQPEMCAALNLEAN